MEDKKKQLDVRISEEVAAGKYSNLAMITHSPSEFVFDFISLMPAQNHAQVLSRVIMTPENAKRVLLALSDNMRKFEAANGTVELHQMPDAQQGMTLNMLKTKGEA